MALPPPDADDDLDEDEDDLPEEDAPQQGALL